MPKTICKVGELPDAMDAGILTKSKDWSYEKEWRIIYTDKSKTVNGGKSMPFEKPSAIYIGERQEENAKINSAKCSEIKKDKPEEKDKTIYQRDDFFVDVGKISDYAGCEKVDLYEMRLSRTAFSLNRTQIK